MCLLYFFYRPVVIVSNAYRSDIKISADIYIILLYGLRNIFYILKLSFNAALYGNAIAQKVLSDMKPIGNNKK